MKWYQNLALSLTVAFSMAIGTSASAQQVTTPEDTAPVKGLEKIEVVIDQLRTAIADGDATAEDIRNAFIYKTSADDVGEVIEFPGTLEDIDAAYIEEAREKILGAEDADAVTQEQVDEIIEAMRQLRVEQINHSQTMAGALIMVAMLTVIGVAGVREILQKGSQPKPQVPSQPTARTDARVRRRQP